MLVVLDRLAPAERVAFVLHDLFDLSFEEIDGCNHAPPWSQPRPGNAAAHQSRVVERSLAAARQLASRARRRVRGGEGEGEVLAEVAAAPADPDRARKRALIVVPLLRGTTCAHRARGTWKG